MIGLLHTNNVEFEMLILGYVSTQTHTFALGPPLSVTTIFTLWMCSYLTKNRALFFFRLQWHSIETVYQSQGANHQRLHSLKLHIHLLSRRAYRPHHGTIRRLENHIRSSRQMHYSTSLNNLIWWVSASKPQFLWYGNIDLIRSESNSLKRTSKCLNCRKLNP